MHDGDEVVATVGGTERRVINGKPSHLHGIRWHTDAAGPLTCVIDRRAGTLAWRDGSSATALASLGPDWTRGMVRRSDLHPVALSAEERGAIVALLEAAGGGAMRGPIAGSAR